MTRPALPARFLSAVGNHWKGALAALVVLVVAAVVLLPMGVRQWRFTHGPDWSTDLDAPREMLDADKDSLLIATIDGLVILDRSTGDIKGEYATDPHYRINDAALAEDGVIIYEGRKSGSDGRRLGLVTHTGKSVWTKDLGKQSVLGVDLERRHVTISDNDKRRLYGLSVDTGDLSWNHASAGAFHSETDQPLVHSFHAGLSWANDRPLLAAIDGGSIRAEGRGQFEVGPGGALAEAVDDRRPCPDKIWGEDTPKLITWGGRGAPTPCRVLHVGTDYAYVEQIASEQGTDPTLDHLIKIFAVSLQTGEATAIDLATTNENTDDNDTPERWFMTKESGSEGRSDEDDDPEGRPDTLRMYDAMTGKEVWQEPWTETWATHSGPDAVLTLRTPTSRFERGDDPRNEKVFELRKPDGDVISRVYGQDREWMNTHLLPGQEAVLILDNTIVMMR